MDNKVFNLEDYQELAKSGEYAFEQELERFSNLDSRSMDIGMEFIANNNLEDIRKLLAPDYIDKKMREILDRIKDDKDVIYKWSCLSDEDQMDPIQLSVLIDALQDLHNATKFLGAVRKIYEMITDLAPTLQTIYDSMKD